MPTVLFTHANAAAMALRAQEARKRNKEAGKLRDSQREFNRAVTLTCDPYLAQRLLRVRKQISRVDRMLELEDNAQCIDRLCAALARLHEIERQCAGRSLPASLKAKEVTTPKRTPASSTTPIQTE